MLGLYGGAVVPGDVLVELLWGTDPPRTAAKALQTHISALRRALGDGFVLTQGAGWTVSTAEIDAIRYATVAGLGREAMAADDIHQAVAHFDEALKLWRGAPELPDGRRGDTERTRWVEGHAALVEDRADALLATGRAAELIGELEVAIADAPLRERRWAQLMLALYRAGRQGEALAAYQRVRTLLADELGVEPGPELRRLDSKIVAQDASLELPVTQQFSSVMRAVTFLLTDIEGSTAAWEVDADAMGEALARHDEIVEQVVTFGGGRLIKTRGEGDATFSVFDRPSAAAAAAVELQEAIRREPWTLAGPMRIRIALHTGEVEFRDGDYFGRAVNRAARLRSLANGGQTLCSGATAELVIDSLADDVVLADLGMRQLKNLTRPEHVFELRLEHPDDSHSLFDDAPTDRPALPAVLTGPGPFVGRGSELAGLLAAWEVTLTAGTHAVLIAGEPGVGKTRLAGEWSRRAHEQGALVLYGRCDEDLGAPYQPFAEALRTLVHCVGTTRLRGLRGIESLLPLVPGLTDVLPDLAAAPRAAPDTERYALFDAVVALLGIASASAPIVLVLDDLHWAAKPTLLLLRHLLRFGEQARVQIVGTYRSTDLDRTHPLAAMLADLHRDGSATRLALGGLNEGDVTAYVAEAGYVDEELARALASVTGGNPFFLIEALRHVEESDGRWDPNSLPQGVREAVSRRLSRLPAETNKALAAAAVVGSRFAIDLVERVVEQDLVDAFDEADKAGIVIEEPGGRYRFNHALVRQSLLAELPSVRRMRLHQKIAAALESEPHADDEHLAELAYHYFECAWAGNARKAAEYCRRAADQAMARLGYEGAADLYDKALHALEELDEELPDRDDQRAELLVARCEALLAAGDVVSATGAVEQLRAAAGDSARIAAWGTCFDGQLSMLTDPERLDQIEAAVGAAAATLARLEDAAGEAKAHTVRAGCLARLGRIGDCETALDQALTAARRAREGRRVNAVLAGAPLAALWGPNPVPRAGGRCLDVVRLLRITTGSPVVEATSTRCQGVLDALRGRAAAGRQLIDSARRTLHELGMRHAVLEVEQFAGIVELVADDAAAAEEHLRKAYNGFRRMGLDADTAETAALLARACLALDRDTEADEFCTESERLAGHAFKAAIAWRSVRAQLLARGDDHDEARRVAEEAVAIAERTDALVDHGDACLALAWVLGVAGDTVGAQAAAERAIGLYELKGAAALAEKARTLRGGRDVPPEPLPAGQQQPTAEPDTACVRVGKRALDAIAREDWDEFEQLFAAEVFVESRRKIVGFTQRDVPAGEWRQENRRIVEAGGVCASEVVIAVRGERLVLTRFGLSTDDVSPGAPHDEMLQIYGIDEEGRISLQMWFDIEDLDGAVAELDAQFARVEKAYRRTPLENSATRLDARGNAIFAERRWEDIPSVLADATRAEDRRAGLRREVIYDRATGTSEIQAMAELGLQTMTSDVVAIRGERLALTRTRYAGRDTRPDAFHTEILRIAEIDANERCVASIAFDLDDLEGAIVELDARYVAGEAAPYAHTWSVIAATYDSFNRHEQIPRDWLLVDHRRGTLFTVETFAAVVDAVTDLTPGIRFYVEAVHRLGDRGAVITQSSHGTSAEGFDAEWHMIQVLTVDGDRINRCEVYDVSDLDSALARFNELSCPAPGLRNAASSVYEHFWNHFEEGDWDAVAELLTDDISNDDRRRVVNAGMERGRDNQLANLRHLAGIRAAVSSTVLATRGQRLLLSRVGTANRDLGNGEFDSEMLVVIETDSNGRIAAGVLFDGDDFDAGLAELDARYLAGEAAECADTWSVVAGCFAAFNRRELPATTPDWINIDHRPLIAVPEGGLYGSVDHLLELAPDVWMYIEAVHRLTDVGSVVTYAASGTSRHGFDAQWREVSLSTITGDLVSRCEVFRLEDLDDALAKFDELSRPAPRLQNAASQSYARYNAYFVARDWDAMADMIADDICTYDRRRVVSGEVLRGRAAQTASMRAAADVGVNYVDAAVVAIRGDRLALIRARVSGGPRDDAFGIDILTVYEVDADEKPLTAVLFDLDDFAAAVEELETRYLAGEAAPFAKMWSRQMRAYAAVNRHELPEKSQDWLNVDHRKPVAFTTDDMSAYVQATFDEVPDVRLYVEAVHRLNNRGAVVTHVMKGTSRQGFDAEWREVVVATADSDQAIHSELFDEADLDAALARFDDVSRPSSPRENEASRVGKRFLAAFAGRDWDTLRELLAEDLQNVDRRRVVNGGTRRGRNSLMDDMRAMVEVGVPHIATTDIATRGERLVLVRGETPYSKQPGAFHVDNLAIGELDADGRIAAEVMFDADDMVAALAELDARYMAGEGAAHAHVWSLVTEAYAAFNRHELSKTTPDWVNIDHRLGVGSAPGDMNSYVGEFWSLVPDISTRIEAVHRLSSLGAVFTHTERGTSDTGFDAEWREVALLTFDGDAINRCELFDEGDLDAALARFDELDSPAMRLDNVATRTYRSWLATYAASDWDAMALVMADTVCHDDRRRVVNGGVQRGRAAVINNMRAIADVGVTNIDPVVIATRGDRLALARQRVSGDKRPESYGSDVLIVIEVDADGLFTFGVAFDANDIEGAFAEFDGRYLAGEAGEYAHTWSVISGTYAAIGRHEIPAWTADVVNIDHRRATAFAPGEMTAYVPALWDQMPDFSVYIEAVHRLGDSGALVTHVARGTSQEGFAAEWRDVVLETIDGDLINHVEIFEEQDLESALTRFDELSSGGASAS
jgi:class 3 adenylate cyclase